MAILLTARGLSHAFSQRPLFQGISFTVSESDRIGLIGPNGAGKSTLLKILAGQITPDSGELAQKTGLRVGYLAQSPAFEPDATVRSAVASGLREHAHDDWEAQARVDAVLAKLQLNGPDVLPSTAIRALSGGWQKRVALARELVREPDLLLLDEPTNHLDVESILWLERQLASASYGTITITHDRMFLQRVSKRIFELDLRLFHAVSAAESCNLIGQIARALDACSLLRGARRRSTSQPLGLAPKCVAQCLLPLLLRCHRVRFALDVRRVVAVDLEQ
ncbi:MAG TPA: ATP-binding cassette domain-containing protein, partial [Polyangiales bacterium]|nr:ATP-binding cassette domain-containing protein [Polyangiales bacterium]